MINPVISTQRRNCRGKSIPHSDSDSDSVFDEKLSKSTSLGNLDTKKDEDIKTSQKLAPGTNKE